VAAVLVVQAGPSPHATAQPAAAAAITVQAWGRNDSGQLGDATRNFRYTPVAVRLPPGVTITSVRTGCQHSLALTSTGKVLAWGDNLAAQLGDGGVTPFSNTPVTVKIPPGAKITAIRAGCRHNLALTSTGKMLAWGDNEDGELGIGSTANFAARPTPVVLPAGTTIKAISAGGFHSLALTTTGQLLAWGQNSNGELGDGTNTRRNAPVSVSLPPGVTVSTIAAGFLHSLAVTSQGKLLAWGDNADGELGNGTTDQSSTPVPVRLPGGTMVRGLFAGCSHSIVLSTTGTVLAWGANGDGQLGDGTITGRLTPVKARMPAGTKVTAISAGCWHSLALTTTGKVLAWGNGEFGQLGNGFTVNSERPATVKLPAGLSVTAIGSGPVANTSLGIMRR
jgi:alpha-tubulin suppressor-like RCC1 family protein